MVRRGKSISVIVKCVSLHHPSVEVQLCVAGVAS